MEGVLTEGERETYKLKTRDYIIDAIGENTAEAAPELFPPEVRAAFIEKLDRIGNIGQAIHEQVKQMLATGKIKIKLRDPNRAHDISAELLKTVFKEFHSEKEIKLLDIAIYPLAMDINAALEKHIDGHAKKESHVSDELVEKMQRDKVRERMDALRHKFHWNKITATELKKHVQDIFANYTREETDAINTSFNDYLDDIGAITEGNLLPPFDKNVDFYTLSDEDIFACRERGMTDRDIEAMKLSLDWLRDHNIMYDEEFVLQPNTVSRIHHLQDAYNHKRVVVRSHLENPTATTRMQDIEHTFVVQHNWADAFAGAQKDGTFKGRDSIRLPFNECAFEFRISDRNVIALVSQGEGEERYSCMAFMQAKECWVLVACDQGSQVELPDKTFHSLLGNFIFSQIDAICIALDAEVATHTVERAPAALNAKRIKSGKPKLADFHVIDLSRRRRIANPIEHGSSEPGVTGKVRLHFRRGHWRHYMNHNTWIKWCLVGNPDLGFIHKQYKL